MTHLSRFTHLARSAVKALPGHRSCCLAVASLLLCVGQTYAAEILGGLFTHAPTPGGVAVIALDVNSSEPPDVRWGNRRIASLQRQGRWYAVVGIPLSTAAGPHHLTLTGTNHPPIPFTVISRDYPEQRIVLKDNSKVTPSPIDMERVNRESKHLSGVKSSRANQWIANGFRWPVTGPISSQFGLKRFFNDQPRRPHGGIDIAVPEGTPIVAPADGVVIDVGDYFFNGKSVFIEHGHGLQTFFAHLSRIDVSTGTRVTAGDPIGAVGATGRVTGAHLHWSIGLNKTWVDPMLFVGEMPQ